QAQENYRIVKDKYDNGVADTDDLLEADVQLLQSEINLAIGKANTVEKHYDLLLANGQLNLKQSITAWKTIQKTKVQIKNSSSYLPPSFYLAGALEHINICMAKHTRLPTMHR